MNTKTRECKISELDEETRTAINSLLDGEEPLLCYESKESGLFSPHPTTVLVITRREVFILNPGTINLFNIMFLDEIQSIGASLDSENPRRPYITISGTGNSTLSFVFETRQFLYTFTNKLRKMVMNAKNGAL